MKNFLKKNLKVFIAFMLGIIVSEIGAYGTTLLTSEEVMHTETQTAKEAIDDLYTKVNNLYTATELTNYGINNYNDGYEVGIKSITDNPKKLVLDGTNGTAVSVTVGYYNEVDTTAVYTAGIKSITDNPTTLTLGSTNGTAVSVTAGYYNKVNTTAVYNAGYSAGYNAGKSYASQSGKIQVELGTQNSHYNGCNVRVYLDGSSIGSASFGDQEHVYDWSSRKNIN